MQINNYDCSLKAIGARIQDRRKECGMTQEELAYLLKCKKDSISSIENGKSENVSFIKLLRISMELKCSIKYLLGEQEQTTDIAYEINRYIGLSENCIDTLHELIEIYKKDEIEVIMRLYNGQSSIPAPINMINSFFDGKVDLAAINFFENFQSYLDVCKIHNEFIDTVNRMIPKAMNDSEIEEVLSAAKNQDDILERTAFALNQSYNKLLQRYDEEGIGNNNKAYKLYEAKKRKLKIEMINRQNKEA